MGHTRIEIRRKVGIRADEVLNYISIGRVRVFSTWFDPYREAKKPDVAMAKDAMMIATWFNANRNAWTDAQLRDADEQILDIQHGPERHLHKVLAAKLGYLDYAAARSWATRHHEVPFSVNVDANIELRDKLYAALCGPANLGKTPEPYRTLLDALHLAFFGLAHRVEGSKWIYL